MCVLHAGGTVVLLPPPMPAKALLSAINDMGCTSISIVPTLARRLLAEHGRLSKLNALICTGAPLNANERTAAMERLSPNLYTFYGSSEGGGVSVLSPSHPAARADSAGRILPGTRVRIVDEAGIDVESGAVGRICYRSAATARGFYNDPETTAVTFREGWFYPGDLGRIDDGFVYITGREKDMIIRGGINVYPEEVERVLRAHPAVVDAAVVGAPSVEFGEDIVAYVALRARVEDEELARWCRRELAPYKVPRCFARMPELPKTAIGKADKAALRARASSEFAA
jgi:acyl-CoA synthetase (AMP-forming)/AMP-acid ligase II